MADGSKVVRLLIAAQVHWAPCEYVILKALHSQLQEEDEHIEFHGSTESLALKRDPRYSSVHTLNPMPVRWSIE